MSEPHRWRERLRLPTSRLALLVLTALLTVLADLTIAIVIGTGIGLALRWWEGRKSPGDWHVPEPGIGPGEDNR